MSNDIHYTVTVQSNEEVRASCLKDGRDKKSEPGILHREYLDLAKGWARLAAISAIFDRKNAEALGEYLFNSLFAEPIKGHFQHKAWDPLNDPHDPNTRIRLCLVFQQGVSPEITSLPWEFLFANNTFLATDERITFFNKYDDWQANPLEGLSRDDLPLRVLFVHTRPKDLEGVAITPVRKKIQTLITDSVKFDEQENPSMPQLREKIDGYRPHILHFLGHGQFDEHTGSFALLDKDGNAFWSDDQSFSDLVRDCPPRLIVLQSCEGGQTSYLEHFTGGAAWLVRQHIPAVVAMRYEFKQAHGWTFMDIFYEKLAKGDPIDIAVQAGRNRLAFLEDNQAHANRVFATPVLWMNLKDGILVPKLKDEKTISSDDLFKEQRTILSFAKRVVLNMDKEKLKKIYRTCLPEAHKSHDANTLEAMLEILWNIPYQEETGRFPVFEFLERLSRLTQNQGLANELRVMIYRLASTYNIDREGINQMITGSDNDQDSGESLYLMVEIVPDDDNVNRDKGHSYKVYISYWKNENTKEYLYKDEKEQGHPIQDIVKIVDWALRKIAIKYPEDFPGLTIEFFLPLDLMSCEVDQWCRNHRLLGKIKIGSHYKTVVRSLDRATDPELKGYWIKKWREYQLIGGRIAERNIIRVYDQSQYKPKKLHGELFQSHWIILGLFAFMPTGYSGTGGLLADMISAGLPIALWPRPNRCANWDADVLKNKIEPLTVSDNGLRELPQNVLLARNCASCNDTENHLTLLWDDPTRLPGNLKSESLRAPKAEGEA